MRSLLVTGGAGFIGSNFVHHWLGVHPDARVIVLDALTYAGYRKNLDGLESFAGFKFVHGDICDKDVVADLLRDFRLNTIVHFAAESHVDRSITGPEIFIRTNVQGTQSLLEAARTVWRPSLARPSEGHFHHVSTDEVYGQLQPGDPAFVETTPYAPNSPYAASKAASDHLVRAYHHTYGLNVTTSNCSNNYGPRHFPEKLIPLALVNVLRGKPITVYGAGKNVRDWLYVDDHCLGISRVIEDGRFGETYNVGGDCEVENIEIIRKLCGLLDEIFAERGELRERFPQAPPARQTACAELITFVEDRPGHDFRYAIDAKKIRDELGFAAAESLASGLRKTVDWYLTNEDWWRGLMDGSGHSATAPG